MFLNCFHHVSYRHKHVDVKSNRVLPAVGSKLSVLKHSFAQQILVTILQHCVVFFNKKKTCQLVTFASEAEPQLFLACS